MTETLQEASKRGDMAAVKRLVASKAALEQPRVKRRVRLEAVWNRVEAMKQSVELDAHP
jgi:hypothetical protein